MAIFEKSSVDEIVNHVLNGVKEVKDFPKANILVTGKTGVGKSTLINAVFGRNMASVGIGKPFTGELRLISDKNSPVNIYDTVGIELDENVQKKVAEEIFQEIKRTFFGNENDYIHAVWYCVNSCSQRFEDYEADFIKRLRTETKIPVFIILTQCFSRGSAENIAEYIRNLMRITPIRVLAEDYETDAGIVEAFGLDSLVKDTVNKMPEFYKNSLISAQKVTLPLKISEANKVVNQTVAGASAAGLVPVPGVSDALLIIPQQILMIARINKVFGLPMDKAVITGVVGALAGTSGATFVGRAIVSNLLKLIPGVGTIAGGAISAATAGTVTKAMGSLYIKALEALYGALKSEEIGDPEKVADFLKSKIPALFSGRTSEGSEIVIERDDAE